MQPLQWEHRPDGLRAPALVCAFKGWNDAADAASSAIQFVGSALGAQRFATIDPEDFYDFQATRPRVKMVDGQAREIVWPAVELFEARVPRAPRDLILMSGSEPSFRWRTFCQLVVELAEVLDVQLVVTLGRAVGRRPPHPPGVGDRTELRSRRSSRAWALPHPPTRAPPGSSGSCTPPVSRPACRRPACGRPFRTTSPPPPIRRPRWRWYASSRAWSGSPSTARSWRRPPPTTTVRSTSPCSAIPTCRRSSSAWSRPPWRRQTTSRHRCRRARRSRATCSGSCASAAHGRASPTAKPGAPRRRLPLGRRAHQPVVADRARRDRRGRLKALGEDPLGHLDRHLAHPFARDRRHR